MTWNDPTYPKKVFVAFALVAWAFAWVAAWAVGNWDLSETHLLAAVVTLLETAWPLLLGIGLAGFVAEKAADVFGKALNARLGGSGSNQT